MANTIVASHGLFYMENAGGCKDKSTHSESPPSMEAEERQASCFALEDERGEGWKGSGATGPTLKETRPSL